MGKPAKTTTLQELEALMPGLPFWSNDEFCKLIASLPDKAPAALLKQMLTQAADRIGSQIASPLYRVVECRLISEIHPVQWDGWVVVEGNVEDQKDFFIRYENGTLKLFLDDAMIEYIELDDASDQDRITLERAAPLLSRMLYFPRLQRGKIKLLKKPD